MIQQVNLYQIGQAEPKSRLIFYLAGLLFIVLVLTILGFYLNSSLNNTEKEVKRINQLISQEQTRIALLKAKIPKQELDASLIENLEQWHNSLAELKQTSQQLTDKNSIQLKGFSSYFIALAEQSIPEVWLTKIELDGQEENIIIEGSSFQPELIPVFLQGLQNEPVFVGRMFSQLIMQKADAPSEQINFKLSTKPEPVDKNKNKNAH